MYSNKEISFITIVFSLGLLIFCDNKNIKIESKQLSSNVPIMHVVNSDSITIQWEMPFEQRKTLAGYEICYTLLKNESNWKIIQNISPEDTTCVIKRSNLPGDDSIFEIAIRAISKNSEKTGYITSTGSNSIPKGGWFILWKKEELP